MDLHAAAAATLFEQASTRLPTHAARLPTHGEIASASEGASGWCRGRPVDLMRTSLQVSPLLRHSLLMTSSIATTLTSTRVRASGSSPSSSRGLLLPNGTDRVFWIMGGPGVGKSAIAAQLCAHECVAAHHFCRFDNAHLSDRRRCCAHSQRS